jgi:hypothetical protein
MSVFRILSSLLFFMCLAQPLFALGAEERTPVPFHAAGGRRVRLWDGEQISGQIFEVNKDTLRMRTAWAERLELPRAAAASIESLPGWRTIFEENDSHLLRPAGPNWTYPLTTPLRAGRISVHFREQEQTHGARWWVELLFQQGERIRPVKVQVAGDGKHYSVEAGGLTGVARQVKRTPDWHRLSVQFREYSLRLTCDEDILWYNLDEGPGGRLQRVTINCQPSLSGEIPRGAVAWAELCIERAVDEHPQPPTDVEQDAVCLLSDDQLFGRILHADRRIIQMEGRFGKRSLPWTAVSSCSFRRPPIPPKANAGAKVRLLVHSGLCADPDILEGVVTAQDAQRLVLRHALLGEVTLERERVREVRTFADGMK